MNRHAASRRLATFALVAVLVAAAGLIRPTGARADAGGQPYQSAAYEDELWSEVATGAWPDTFPAEWAAPELEAAAEAASAMPAVSALGTLVLGATAFELGWKIGRTVDTKWLHLSGDLGVRLATTPESTYWEWRTSFACGSSWTSGSCLGQAFYLRTGSYQYYCDPYTHPFMSYWWGTAGCPYPKWLFDQLDGAPGTRTEITNTTSTGCGSTWGPCYVKWLGLSDVRDRIVHSAPQPFTNQAYGASTTIPAPVHSASSVTAIRDTIGSGGTALENEANAGLDPTHWDRPTSAGSGGGYNGGGTTTSPSGDECDLEDDVLDATWEALYSSDPTTYQAYCDDAWAAARSLGAFDEFGGFQPDALGLPEVAIPGVYLDNEAVVETLTADGSQIGDWAKMKTPPFESGHGPAEIHWYQNLNTGGMNLSIDFKLVFTQIPG